MLIAEGVECGHCETSLLRTFEYESNKVTHV